MKKPKVRHGVYIEKPICKYCGEPVPHKWLDGDYTLIVCDKKDCLDKLLTKI